ncbi:MAG: BRCT domain-containing protein [Chloroflexota bacterium]|mgnify:CR=1 FL=1
MGKQVYLLRRPGKLGTHGQPTSESWNAPRIATRSIDELIGISKGLISDHVLNEEELGFLTSWLNANQHVLDVWPANVLAARINLILEDKIIDQEEREDLFTLLAEIVGYAQRGADGTNRSTTLPFTKPAPPVFFKNQYFCLTGQFVMGPRANHEFEIKARGGITHVNVTEQTNYLVIGSMGSTDWLHSTYGRKIETAVSLAERGHPIALISEEHWADHLL